mmetsp:Transcript_65860/g.183506  ORF Transcript_65860/g.183506 Transcript_65860/m.183506 type:complete len:90 (-) Transcript_65860:18-287(-)
MVCKSFLIPRVPGNVAAKRLKFKNTRKKASGMTARMARIMKRMNALRAMPTLANITVDAAAAGHNTANIFAALHGLTSAAEEGADAGAD